MGLVRKLPHWPISMCWRSTLRVVGLNWDRFDADLRHRNQRIIWIMVSKVEVQLSHCECLCEWWHRQARKYRKSPTNEPSRFKLQPAKYVNVCLHVQSHRSVHVSGVHCHVCILYRWLCSSVFLCRVQSTALYRVQQLSLYFKPRMSRKQALKQQWGSWYFSGRVLQD